jgi:hypothetical protein
LAPAIAGSLPTAPAEAVPAAVAETSSIAAIARRDPARVAVVDPLPIPSDSGARTPFPGPGCNPCPSGFRRS